MLNIVVSLIAAAFLTTSPPQVKPINILPSCYVQVMSQFNGEDSSLVEIRYACDGPYRLKIVDQHEFSQGDLELSDHGTGEKHMTLRVSHFDSRVYKFEIQHLYDY